MNLHYFDPFCGSGLINIDTFGKSIKFPGSPIVALSHTMKFDNYYFSDNNKESLKNLEKRTSILFPDLNLQYNQKCLLIPFHI